MRKQTFSIIRKILSIFFLVSLIVFVTATLASAKSSNTYEKGYQEGLEAGKETGETAGKEDCLKYGKNGVLTKIPSPSISDEWPSNHKNGYVKAFKAGYVQSYNEQRFKCLKNNEFETQ